MAQLNRERSPVQNDPIGFFGPWLMALVGITFMMVCISSMAVVSGILAAQSTKYFSAFGYEGLRIFA
ncbi:hypothetical protein FRC04_008034, partial [Tulasnella sp. 424]